MNKANLKSVLTVVRDMIRRNAERGMKLAQSAMKQSRAARVLASKAQTTAEAAHTTANQAQTTAEAAHTTANRAQTTAEAAQTTAEAAQTTASKCVQYEPQTLTDAQKTRARLNIGATNNYNDLKNRPCYFEATLVYTDTADTAAGEFYYGKYVTSKTAPTIEPGAQYFVNDKVALFSATEVTIKLTNSQVVSVYCIGNLQLLNKIGIDNLKSIFGLYSAVSSIVSPKLLPDNGLNFCVGRFTNNSSMTYYGTISKTSNQYSVYKVTDLKTLDEAMIPDSIARVADLTQDVIISSSTEGSTKKFKITVDDTGAISATEVTA